MMIRSNTFRDQPSIWAFVKFVVVKGGAEGAELAGGFKFSGGDGHECRIDASGKEGPDRHITAQAQADGVPHSFPDEINEFFTRWVRVVSVRCDVWNPISPTARRLVRSNIQNLTSHQFINALKMSAWSRYVAKS